MKTLLLIFSALFLLTGLTTALGQEVKINHNGTDGLVVRSDGSIEMEGNATVWDDLMVFPNSVKIKGSTNIPTDVVFASNLYLLGFNEGDQVYFTVQIPHSYKIGSTLEPHVHWTTISGNPSSGDVGWGLEYSASTIAGTFPSSTSENTGTTIVQPSSGTSAAYQHTITSLGTIDGSGLGISSVLVCRLYRTTDGSYGSPALLLGMDFHFEKDTEGSRSNFTK